MALRDITLLYAIIVGVELIVTGGRVGAVNAQPHPYWLVILPIAAARGTVAGLIAATVAVALEVIGLVQIGEFEIQYLLDLGAPATGLIFFGLAFLVGEIHDVHATRYYGVVAALDKERSESAVLTHERAVLEAATHHLRRQYMERPLLRAGLLEAASALENAHRESALTTVLNLVQEQCGAGMVSAWKIDANRELNLLQSIGWQPEQEAGRIAAIRASSTIRAGISEGRGLSCLRDDFQPHPLKPLLVAPLADAQGVLWGVLCLDDIEPVFLNTETASVFFGLARWLAEVLSRLDREGRLHARSREVKWHVRLRESDDLGERLRLEYDRAVRHGTSLRTLCVYMPESDEDDPDDVILRLESISAAADDNAVYSFGYPGCHTVVLSGYEQKDAEYLRDEVKRLLADESATARVRLETVDADTPDVASLLAACAEDFRDASPYVLTPTPPVHVPEAARAGDRAALPARVRDEKELSKRLEQPLEVAVLRVPADVPSAAEAFAIDTRRAMAGLRPVDGLYTLGNGAVVLVLPQTDRPQAEQVVIRFLARLRERNPDAVYGPIELTFADPNQLTTDPDHVFALADGEA